jgi:thioredoxin reductase (NADPH)
MSGNEVYDLIIIGGGPGGLTAGIYGMRAALKTVLIEVGLPGGQMNNSDSVENWRCRSGHKIFSACAILRVGSHLSSSCGP